MPAVAAYGVERYVRTVLRWMQTFTPNPGDSAAFFPPRQPSAAHLCSSVTPQLPENSTWVATISRRTAATCFGAAGRILAEMDRFPATHVR
jgi:hypothetical protein